MRACVCVCLWCTGYYAKRKRSGQPMTEEARQRIRAHAEAKQRAQYEAQRQKTEAANMLAQAAQNAATQVAATQSAATQNAATQSASTQSAAAGTVSAPQQP